MGGARRGLTVVQKEIDEIGRTGKLKEQNEDGAKSKRIEDGIENVERGRGRE
jgi:hypothetical protein